jgi:hypothetical protein
MASDVILARAYHKCDRQREFVRNNEVSFRVKLYPLHFFNRGAASQYFARIAHMFAFVKKRICDKAAHRFVKSASSNIKIAPVAIARALC